MAQSKGYKKFMALAYGLGAAVVILGALFKLMHWPGASAMLIIGLGAEAAIFALSAFEPVHEDLDWSLVYPELAGGESKGGKKKEVKGDAQSMLSQKLDNMLKEAKLDANLMSSLSTSIQNFKGAADNIQPAVDSIAATKKYSEQLSLAAGQMESLNSLYKVQMESASRQAEANKAAADNAENLQAQMASLTSNLSSLNGVYGGMLSAMGGK
ncbi:type IX secretion system motor protein PorL/GldL [Pseudofulvibacter geojedonensis]|uniref:Gliding motility protein GldL n=1 Tax=Pseudofulvibacter geojedonensis TaxID=1123758 RepID=A0ABW3I3U2_9FLAO